MTRTKQITSLILLLGVFAGNANAALPIYPAEIIARDLSIPGASWAGHVGVTTAPNIWQDAYQVIEVLRENPVIQTNFITQFKTRSPYWGSRYGISDRGNNALRILREANFQKDLGCASYTITAQYDISRGGYGTDGRAHPTYCGYFRCDTFINFIFHWGGYDLPTYSPQGGIIKFTIPNKVFNAFPKGNGDGPYAHQSMAYAKNNTAESNISINTTTLEVMLALESEQFTSVIDVPPSQINHDGIVNLLGFAKNNQLSLEKRVFILDKLGFVASVEQIPELIDLYEKLDSVSESLLKKQIIATSQNIYQRYSVATKYPREKNLLLNFYSKSLSQPLSAYEKNIAIRGFINLSSEENIVKNIDAINSKIDERLNKLSLQSALKLKLAIFNKSPELEPTEITHILKMLEKKNSSELEGIFNIHIIDRLSHTGPKGMNQTVKHKISTYLDSIQYKYDSSNNTLINEDISIFNFGRWLEAKSIIESESFEETSQRVSDFIARREKQSQKIYVVGLSNSKYMQKAFKEKKILNDFMKNNRSIYFSTVGATKSLAK